MKTLPEILPPLPMSMYANNNAFWNYCKKMKGNCDHRSCNQLVII